MKTPVIIIVIILISSPAYGPSIAVTLLYELVGYSYSEILKNHTKCQYSIL